MNQENNKIKHILDSFPKDNNLEWLRLIFALQVVISHSTSILKPEFSLPGFISGIPGVPGFFFISGFLIYSSYINSPGKRYFENRLLRLFPALVIVSLGGGGVILFALGFESLLNNFPTFAIWFISQVTIGQAYNPELFRSVGIGVINGSLWTITTEIIFYLSIPFIVWLEKRSKYALFLLITLSFLIYSTGPFLLNIPLYNNKSIFDFLALTPIVWGWMFGFGILAVKNYHKIRLMLVYAPLLLFPMLVMASYGENVFTASSGNRLGLFYFICFSFMILWLSFWVKSVPLQFDLSYGAYIWHAPIINLLLVLEYPNLLLCLVLTIFMASISWLCIEKPMLKLKRKSLRPI